MLDACARCGDEQGPFPAFDLDEGGVLCVTLRACVAGRRAPAGDPRDGAAHPRRGAARGARRAARRGHHRHRAPRRRPRSSTTSSAACAAPRSSSERLDALKRTASSAFGRRKRPRLPSVVRMGNRRPDGPRRQPGEAARPRVPVERDLRRLPLHVGLRPARRAAQAQREGRLVALDGAAARRHRRPRRRDPHGAQGVGGERPPRRTFTDPLVDCRNCKERFRADQLPESGACPNCGAKDSFTEARQFNLMFKTYVGPVEDDASVAYLRPETAQGIFVNFANVQTTTREEAAVRHRADRQVVPQRDHARQLHLPHA